MRNLLFIISFIVSLHISTYANNADMQAMRALCAQAQLQPNKATEFYNYMNTITINTALLKGYKAMSQIMLCKHTANVFSKLYYFNKGKALLEQAINQEPNNTELIFFRYITQRKVPALLNYSSNKVADKQKLLAYLKQKELVNDTQSTLYKTILTHIN